MAAGLDATHFNLPADIAFTADGNIYVATEGQTGGNAADGMVLKIEPVN